MSIFTFIRRCSIALCLLLCVTLQTYAQRIYADDERTGRSGLLCVNCTVVNAGNAADGNTQTYSQINVTVGLAASTYQELIFTGTKPAANTEVRVKLGTGDNLLDLTALGGITLRAYNGNSPASPSYSAATLLSALSNNNQLDVGITPTQPYDRIRITPNGGLAGVLSSIYVYDAYFNGNGPAACNAAVDELHGISAGLLNLGADVGGVVNPRNAIDGNINTASTLNAGVGAVGAYAQQTIIYQTPSAIGDSVRLTLSIPQALVDAGVFTRIGVSTFLGNTDNNDTQLLSSALLSVRLLDLNNGRRRVVVTYAPTKVFDRVQLRLGGGIANVLSSLNLHEAEKLIPRPVISIGDDPVAGNVQACAGSSVTLTATGAANTTFSWYTAASGGTPIFTGSSFTTPVLNAGTTYYVAASRPGCTDQSERTPVNIIVNQIPAAPVIANSEVTVCPGQQATFTAQGIAGVSVRWYTAATGGTPVFTGNTFTTSALTANTTYYAEAVAGGTCVSATRTAVTATISPLPANPSLTDATVTVCRGDAATFTIASPVNGVIYRWYTAATGGTPAFTGTSFTTPALTASRNYYVEAENVTGCTSAQRAQATATVSALPANPVLATNNLTINAGQTATITVSNAQTGITYRWYTSEAAATPVFTGVTYTTPALYTNTTYYVEGVNAAGCPSAARTAVTISVAADNNSPCVFANQQSSNISGLCIGCSVTSRNNAVDADTTTASTITVVAGLLGGYAEQELQFQKPGFTGDTVRLVVQSPVGLADANVAGNIQVALYNGTTEVVRYNVDNALVKVRLLGGNGRYAISVPATGNYDRVSIRLNSGVASLLTSLQVYYAIQQYPTPVFNPAAPEICAGSTAQINITAPAGGTFRWYTVPTGGTAVYTGTNFTTPELNANTTYYVENVRDDCTGSTRTPVQVLVNTPPAKPVVNPPSATIFSGQTATFTVAPINNVTIRWYTQASGGTPVFTGNTFTTPALSDNTTYYAEAATGSCVNPDRTVVPVTVNAVVIPTVAVTPATQAVNAGESATLTASSNTPGAVFNWYTTPTGGTSIYTGAVFNTPAVFNGTTYYAEAVIPATGARSPNRASGVITVNASDVDPVPCDAAISQTTDINGVICLGCSVSNAGGSVDGDLNTFSRINVPVGLLNAYAQQTLTFANTGRAGDSVIVELGTPGSLADVTVLSGIRIATYNGNTYNNDRFTVNGSLLSIRLISGTSRFRVAFKAGSNFNKVEIRLNSAVAGVLNSLNIYGASQSVAAPVINAANVTTCEGSQATLTATVPDYVTVRWYTQPTGGSPVFTGNVFNTPVLNANTTYYAEASRTASNCAQTVRTPVNVTVTTTPDAPVVNNANVTICSGETATFTAQAVNGVTFRWYTAATGGTPVFTGAQFTTPALTATTSYYVEAAAGQCQSITRTKVTANVTATPLVPQVSQTPVATCSGSSAVLSATSTQPGVTFRWYTSATGGTPVFTGAQFTTPALTADRTYYVEAVAGNCTSATRAAAVVDVNPLPANPTVTVNPTGGQVAAGERATLTATSTTAGVTFLWYSTATGGSPVHTGATFTTPALSSTTTYYVEARLSSTGCTSAQRTPVTVTVNPIFNTDCDFASTQTTDVNGGLACIGCSVTGDNNAVDADTANFSQLNLPVAVLGSYVAQTLTFGDGGVKGDTVAVKISVPASLASVGVLQRIQIASYNGTTYNGDRTALNNSLIRIQLLSGNQTAIIKFVPGNNYDRIEVRLNSVVASVFNTLNIYYATKHVELPQLDASTVNICEGSKATFTVANARAGVIYRWYTTPTGGAPVFTGTTFTTGDLTANTTYYIESVRQSNNCANPNRVAATANVTETPANPVLSQNSAEICSGESVTFNVTNANGSTVRWYNAATGGTLLFTGASYTVSPITNATYYAELSNGNCTSAARTVATVTVNQRPAMPDVVSADLEVCAGSPATLAVLDPEAGVTYRWYAAATGGTALFTGNTYNTNAVTANTTIYVEAANTASGCVNNGGRRAVNITVNDLPASPTLSATSSQVCNGGSVTFSVTNPVAGITYNWYTTNTAATPVFTGVTYTVNNVTADATYYVEAVNDGNCASSSRTQTQITVLPVPEKPEVEIDGGGSSVCAGSSATLNVVNPQASLVYRWYTVATGGSPVFTGASFTTPALNASRTYYVEAANAGNCTSSARTSITVNVTALPPAPALTSNNVSVCIGASATLSINSPQAGITYRWYDSPAQTTLLFTGATYTTGPISSNTTFYVSATNAAGCSSSTLTAAQVTVQPSPSAPVVVNASTSATCEGNTATLNVQDPDAGETYRWYTSATGGNPVFTGTTYTTGALTATITYYVEASNNNGGCTSDTRTAITVTVSPVPDEPQVEIDGGVNGVCTGSSATLNVENPQAGLVYSWYTAATGGTAVFTGTSYTTPALNANRTYYVEAANSNGCASSSRTAITVNVTAPPAAPTLTNANVMVCTGATATLSVSSPQTGIIYRWYDSPAQTTLLFTGGTYVTAPVNSNTTFYVSATNAAGCSSTTLTEAKVTVQPAPGAPVVANASNAATCEGTTATLNIQNPVAGLTYRWYSSATGGTAIFTGTSFTTGALTTTTTYYVEAENTNGGCTSATRTSITVTVAPSPEAPQVSAANVSVCPGSTATLTATSSAGGSIRWYASATGGTPLFTGSSYTTSTITTSSTYYAEAQNAGGCTSATRTAVQVNVIEALQRPQLSAGAITNTSVTFNWTSVGGATGYEISIDNGSSFMPVGNVLNYTVNDMQPNTSVTAIVRAVGSVSCLQSANSDALTLTTGLGSVIFVPNAFTPNGDGNNDILLVYGSIIKSMNFYVYDQWGELIFRSNNQGNGWDGTYKGNRLPVGVYVYYLDAVTNDGQKVNKKGTITLLR